ncbi:MAG: glycosyltransferase family 4 protein [Bacteroidota bacterium]|nr:glycosyltransferase family 4 protein [Bacteroidota bacterium]MDP4191842.1 glycosyltransferase family 4 protein [Bacteroidota bacterium]MDP4195268.1 glycosyltransferase family 4 protein [Bacteroidota bacterium]
MHAMRVLASCLSRSWGGMEMFVISSIKLMLADGYSVCLACIKDSPIERESKDLPIDRILVDSPSLNYKNVNAFIKNLKSNDYDIIHTHYSKDLWIIVPVLKMLGLSTPLLMTKHLGSAIKKKDILHRFIYKRLNHAVAISEVIRKNILDTTVMDEKDVSVVYNFIDNKEYRNDRSEKLLRKEYKIDDSTIVLGMVGRITPAKGHEDVINAIKELDKNDLNIKVFVIGGASSDEIGFEEKLKSLVKEYGLDKYFIFTGFRSNIADLLPSFDIFLFPSHAEAFGLSLLEAMSAGLPNVVCFSEGVKEIAIENVTSLTYDKDDYKTLASQILKLINDKDLQAKLSENSVNRAGDFSTEAYQEEISKLYASLL